MTSPSAEAFVHTVSGLLDATQTGEVQQTLCKRFPEPRGLAKELIQRGWITPYQANCIFQNRADDLLLGNFVLLERLGEGGMGQVFKARHQKLGRVVALKIIRKERLKSQDAVRRFHREIQAAAQLRHPNVVLAYDADQEGGTHFFAMEYVEGTDLAQLVKKGGPLPVAQACDYIHQAALGLQHAFEHGLVHRDIKPANMLLTKAGVIKLLDMGLALLTSTETAEPATRLTVVGSIMGTPDYIAPEQAMSARDVDIRADIYSLGCTLYFLLTGRVPFPGGGLTDKLIKHQVSDPEAVEQIRPEVPVAVGQIVRKMMAKKPADRYQTPGEVAAALATPTAQPSAVPAAPMAAESVAVRPAIHAVPASAPAAPINPWADLASETIDSPSATATRRGTEAPPGQSNKLRWLLAGAGALALLVVVLVVVFRRPDEPPKQAIRPIIPPRVKLPGTVPEGTASSSEGTADFLQTDLSGWEGLMQHWTSKDGSLTGSSPTRLMFSTFLCSKKRFRDFELSFEVRLKDNVGNSGVQFRSDVLTRDTFAVVGPQADIGPGCWGGLWGENLGGMIKAAPQDKILIPGDFNDYYLRCVGKHVTIKLNGEITVDGDFPDIPAEGIIAFQTPGGNATTPNSEVVFRKIRFKDLGGPEPAPHTADSTLQGEYTGTVGATAPLGAQVVAEGDGRFSLVFHKGGLPGAGAANGAGTKIAGLLSGGTVIWDEAGWTGKLLDGRITGQAPDGPMQLTRTVRTSPTMGAKPEPGALVLFDGFSTAEWLKGNLVDGNLLADGAITKKSFKDFKLHLEFRIPLMPKARGQARGNSGVFLQNRYELQILDSFGLPPSRADCGALYNIAAPKVNMSLPPLSWQTYDLEFQAARYDAAGKLVKHAEVSVKHNGTPIHDRQSLAAPTVGGAKQDDTPGPIYLQQHGSPVRFRNIWIVERK